MPNMFSQPVLIVVRLNQMGLGGQMVLSNPVPIVAHMPNPELLNTPNINPNPRNSNALVVGMRRLWELTATDAGA